MQKFRRAGSGNTGGMNLKSAFSRQFVDVLNSLPDRDFLMAKIAIEAAPTIAGLKPSSLITFSTKSRNLHRLWERFKGEGRSFLGLQYSELKKTESYTLVLFYRSELLGEVVAQAENVALFDQLGCPCGKSLEQILQHLRDKLEHAFPHEIGLLLGIPREDVIGFMNKGGSDCLLCGYWKVYHNPVRAVSIFQGYDKAKLRVMNGICNLSRRKRKSA